MSETELAQLAGMLIIVALLFLLAHAISKYNNRP